jgi:hypothetical protein
MRFHSRNLSVAQLSEKLGVHPSSSCEIGTPLNIADPNSKLRNENLWKLEYQRPPDSRLKECIAKPIQFLEDRKDVIESIRSEVEIDLFCGCGVDADLFALCLCFDRELIQRLASLHLDVLIDVMPYKRS